MSFDRESIISCNPDNNQHISPKHLGMLGLRVSVLEPTISEINRGNLTLNPVMEELGIAPAPIMLEPNKYERIINTFKRAFGK